MPTNYGKVKIKKDRECNFCGKKLKKGTLCLTVSSSSERRNWYCDEYCYELQHEPSYDIECDIEDF